MTETTDLLDVNVWLALCLADHPGHRRAKHYWYAESLEKMAFCRTTALGLVRLSTNPSVTAGEPLSTAEAWRAYRAFRSLPEVVLAPEPPQCDDRIALWVSDGLVTSRMWTDTYLAAFASCSGMRLVTFDGGFARFPGLSVLHLRV